MACYASSPRTNRGSERSRSPAFHLGSIRLAVWTSWLENELTEGKNRQVRRMTAAVGHPTLRLMRVTIGGFRAAGLAPGEWRELSPAEMAMVTAGSASL